MNSKTFKRISRIHGRLIGKYTKELIEGGISVEQYLDFHERIDRSIMLFARTFDDVNDYEAYLKTNCPDAYPVTAEETVDHEVEHYNIGVKHGLKRMTFGLFEFGNKGGHQGVLIDHSSENCRGWDKEKLLGYIKDTYEWVSNPSKEDIKSLKTLKSLGV